MRVEHRSIEWDNQYCDLLDESILARKKQRNIKYAEHFPLVRMAHDEVSGLFVFRTSSPYYYSACSDMMKGIYGSIRTSAYCKQIIRGDLSETQKYKISPLSDEELRKYREDLSEQNAGLSNYTYQFVYQLDPDTRTISLFSPQSSELAQNVLRGFARNWGSYWRWLDVILNHDGGHLYLNKLDEPIFAVVQEEKNGELSLKVAPLDRDSYYSVEKIYSVIEMSKVAQVFTW
ncbi:hypothetical protein MHO82_21200 [Vibrio sp. Of7-15]|uniref:hypothetical protein n=1 Tax=Vibrio sp. Of7-15 TaxID=2724879 RepID=UPI001EF20F1C|nr:hypothetical protein [Vibrio sp. Of7-15]MCG7499387.1 hypothetical protein [Vibrio sp. Of7-15]